MKIERYDVPSPFEDGRIELEQRALTAARVRSRDWWVFVLDDPHETADVFGNVLRKVKVRSETDPTPEAMWLRDRALVWFIPRRSLAASEILEVAAENVGGEVPPSQAPREGEPSVHFWALDGDALRELCRWFELWINGELGWPERRKRSEAEASREVPA